jgi:hypothetical protein
MLHLARLAEPTELHLLDRLKGHDMFLTKSLDGHSHLLRLSVGLEYVDHLIADLQRSFEVIGPAAGEPA